jgi:hypothetical protein
LFNKFTIQNFIIMKKTLLLSAFALFLASSTLVATACDKEAKGKHECVKGGACCKKGGDATKACCKKGGSTETKPAAPSNEKK